MQNNIIFFKNLKVLNTVNMNVNKIKKLYNKNSYIAISFIIKLYRIHEVSVLNFCSAFAISFFQVIIHYLKIMSSLIVK